MVMRAFSRKTLALAIAAAVTAAACGTGSGTESGAPERGSVTLVLGAYTTPREAYGKAILPAFREHWKRTTGQDVEFQESYQGSGAQSRAIVGGFEADVAALSLEADVDKIAEAGLITHDWRGGPHGGMVSNSIAVIAVRPGNPQGIRDWEDLVRPGLDVLTPDPKTSGGAQWNINALYGAALRGHVAGVPANDPAAAEEFLSRVFRNVRIMDKGARESITNFERGVGDAAITYENEVLVARMDGEEYDYVIPSSTILIQNPVALIDKNVDAHGVRDVAEAFVAFLHGPEAQRAFAEYGLRSVDESVAAETAVQYPPVEDLWTIDALGGWDRVATEIYGSDGRFTRAFEAVREAR
jgi:sulfate transport system substrate-binding protein